MRAPSGPARGTAALVSQHFRFLRLTSWVRAVCRGKPFVGLPSTTESLVESDEVGVEITFALNERILRDVERALGSEQVQEVSLTLGVKLGREFNRSPVGGDCSRERPVMFLFLGERDECVLDFLQPAQDGLLIVEIRFVAQRFLEANVRHNAASLKDR